MPLTFYIIAENETGNWYLDFKFEIAAGGRIERVQIKETRALSVIKTFKMKGRKTEKCTIYESRS